MSTENKTPKVYTRTGDKGQTALVSGKRVAKSHLRLEAYGTVDELNSLLGLMIATLISDLKAQKSPEIPETTSTQLSATLQTIQNELFNIGSQLACDDKDLRARLPGLDDSRIERLEKLMDTYSDELQPLKNFILPGGSQSAALAHVARTVCRRAERECVRLAEQEEVDAILIRYLNRLSDYLFVLARHLNRVLGIAEPLWTKS